jgi:hypothetical protein
MKLLLLALSLTLHAADPIIITPNGPPVFTAPGTRDLYAVTVLSVFTGQLSLVFVEANSIPAALAAATQPGVVPISAWRVE